MSDTCVICGTPVPEGRQVCPYCEIKFEPNKDIINAMINRQPVEYEGIKYGCISAFIIRGRSTLRVSLGKPYILQVELMSKRGNGCVIADPKKIKVLERWEK